MDEVNGAAASKGGFLGVPDHFLLAMLLLSCFPFVQVIAIVLIALAKIPVWERVAGSLAVLLLLPPFLERCTNMLASKRNGRIAAGTGDFLAWWASLHFQLLFNRIPMIEELLRVVPGLYSLWLRLWGSRIGKWIFWSPGMVIFDRGYLDIGDEVVFGGAVRLTGHLVRQTRTGGWELSIAPIKIGARAMVGGQSSLMAGTEVAPGIMVKGRTFSAPFTIWREGKMFGAAKTESAEKWENSIF